MELSDQINLCAHVLWVLWSFQEQVRTFSVPCALCGPLEWTGRMQPPAIGEGLADLVD